MANTVKVPVPEKLVEKIEEADARQRTLNTVMTQFLDSHSMDTDDSAINSKVFEAFQDKAVRAEQEYMHMKDELVQTCFPRRDRPFIVNWVLNYQDCVVTVKMEGNHKFSGETISPSAED